MKSDYELPMYQIYVALKPYGRVAECSADHKAADINEIRILIEYSDETEKLKPSHELYIGEETFVLNWINDHDRRASHRFQTSIAPGLVPDQQSPEHILNALNDDCIREVFLKLDKSDLCKVAYVCKRFQDVLLSALPKHVEITNENSTPLWQLDSFVRKFGASIKTASITTDQCPDIVIALIAEHCFNLEDLKGSARFNSSKDEVANVFRRLRRLDLHHTGDADFIFQSNAQLESLHIEQVDHLPPIQFPALRDFAVSFCGSDESSIPQFFELNHRIEKISLRIIRYELSTVLSYLPNLTEFHTTFLDADNNDLTTFGQLKRLHTLRIEYVGGDARPMFRALVQNGVQLKHLELGQERIQCNVRTHISEMKFLEHFTGNVLNDGELIELVSKCTNLKELNIGRRCEITPRGIRIALACAKHLKKAKFHFAPILTDCQTISADIYAIDELRQKQSIDVRMSIYGFIDILKKFEVS